MRNSMLRYRGLNITVLVALITLLVLIDEHVARGKEPYATIIAFMGTALTLTLLGYCYYHWPQGTKIVLKVLLVLAFLPFVLIYLVARRGQYRGSKPAVEPSRTSTLAAHKPIRESIPSQVKMYVWQRDQGRCVQCGSNEKLEYDHIIPVSKGGSNTDRNLQLLCERCNRSKGASIR